jgi:hypothetical protein
MKRVLVIAISMLLAALLLSSCQSGGGEGTVSKRGKIISKPEVLLDRQSNNTKVVLPEVPELRWDFFQEAGKPELTCKFRLKVNFKEDGKFMAKVQFMDINKFPVTMEEVKFIGKKGEETTYEKVLYIDPKISSRITKAQILLYPIR